MTNHTKNIPYLVLGVFLGVAISSCSAFPATLSSIFTNDIHEGIVSGEGSIGFHRVGTGDNEHFEFYKSDYWGYLMIPVILLLLVIVGLLKHSSKSTKGQSTYMTDFLKDY
jgi:uncharacterized membrane protein affecting hemolysin expression